MKSPPPSSQTKNPVRGKILKGHSHVKITRRDQMSFLTVRRAARKQYRRGVTFIELIGVLVVAIIIIAGALALYSEANTSSRTNQLIVAVGALTGSVRALHANVANYGGGSGSPTDLAPVLVSANAVPPGMLITGSGASTQISHAFGGRIQVFGMGQLFSVSAQGLDEDICIRLSTESTAKASSGLRGAYITASTAETMADAGSAADEVVTAVNGSGVGVVAEASNASTGGIFVYGAQTGNVGAASAVIPIAPSAADAACATNDDNQVGWVFQ
jgi:Tfp pilus assembly protein PilE